MTTSPELMALIRQRHHESSIMIPELRLGCGAGNGSERRIDMWALDANPAKSCTATAYEIKVSRSDFRRDLVDPLKQRGARLISDQFFYVAPRGLIRRDEVPDWTGLLEPSEYGYLHQVVQAPIRSKDSPSWPLVVSLLRRHRVDVPGFEDAA